MSSRWGHPPADCGWHSDTGETSGEVPSAHLHSRTATHAAQLSISVDRYLSHFVWLGGSVPHKLGHLGVREWCHRQKTMCFNLTGTWGASLHFPASSPHRLNCYTDNSPKMDFKKKKLWCPQFKWMSRDYDIIFILSGFSLSPIMVLKLDYSSSSDCFSYTTAICQPFHF